MTGVHRNALARRLVACLFGGFVLALMYGSQEGSQTNFTISFTEATKFPRILVFLGIGVVAFVVMTFWPRVSPFVRRPGVAGIGVGFLFVLVGVTLLTWYDPVGKFAPLATQVAKTGSIGVVASAYFGGLAYGLWLVCLAIGAVAVIAGVRVLGWALTGVAVVSAVLTWIAHAQVLSVAGGIDHSLGVYVTVVGYVIYAGAGIVVARATSEHADPRAAVDRALGWRPGLPFVVVAALLLLGAFTVACWFAPLQINRGFGDISALFTGTGVAQFALVYFDWLGYVLAAVTVLVGLAAAMRRLRLLGWITAALGLAGLAITFVALHAIAKTGAQVAEAKFGREWLNLGVGGWIACIAFGSLVLAGVTTATEGRPLLRHRAHPSVADLPLHRGMANTGRSPLAKAIVPVAIIVALFYPPTLALSWQTTIVTQIGPYILLAIGLNVVVGWAGLLDLGYIAFYGVGSYTTAYITGSLPVKPPSWLNLSPLWAIPFAIIACLVAGVVLGAPTLRLRGDYLAIVTLGFGEIIQVLAINVAGFTGGPLGPTVPNPVLDLGFVSIHWGLDELPYWYLLLVFIVVVVILFYRLEGSRLGRAWAAIREDEVAAQATGINTTRAKLLAFAIGASTSGLAGVYYATQVGYFDPTAFTLQISILIVAYVVFGGMGSLVGCIAGAAALTWLPIFLKSQVPQADAQMWIGAVVLLMMIFRPAGLIPARRRAAELRGFEQPASSEERAVPIGEGL